MQKQGGALDIREAATGLEELAGVGDLGARGGREIAEGAGQFFWVVGGDPVEIDEVSVDVVDDFQAGLGIGQEEGAAAGEGLDVAGLGGDVREEAFEVAGLSARPGDEWQGAHARRTRHWASRVNPCSETFWV